MSLQKQLVHINIAKGLAKKDDQFLGAPDNLDIADNVEFDDASTVIRRGGQRALSATSLDSNYPAGVPYRTFTHQGQALIQNSGGTHRLSSGGGSSPVLNYDVDLIPYPYTARGAGLLTSRIGSVGNTGDDFSSSPIACDCAVLGDLTCYVWESTPAFTEYSTLFSVKVKVINTATGFTVFSTELADAAATVSYKSPRVVASVTQNKFFIYYVSKAATPLIKGLTVSTVGVATAAVTVVTMTAGDAGTFDVVYSADATKLGLVRDAGAGMKGYSLSTTTGTTATFLADYTCAGGVDTITALITLNAGSYKLHAFHTDIATSKKVLGGYMDMTTPVASAEALFATAAGATGRLVVAEGVASDIYIAFDDVASTSIRTVMAVRTGTVYTGTYDDPNAALVGWCLAGRMAVFGGRYYLPVALLSYNNQGTTYVVDFSSLYATGGVPLAAPPVSVIARVDYGECALGLTNWFPSLRVPSMLVRGNTLTLPYTKYETDLRLAGAVNVTSIALASALIDFDSQLGFAEVNGVTLVAGACPQIYDGERYVEEGFHHGPEIISVTSVTGTGGAYDLNTSGTVAGTYTVCFTIAWQDAQGNWHESAPSNEKVVTTAGAERSFNADIIVPPTQKRKAHLLMYRTQISSTDTALYLATYADGTNVLTDAALVSGEQLYTAGSVLPNTPAPSCRHLSVFQKRLVLSGCGDGSLIHWSKTSDVGFGVEFSSGDPFHKMTVPAGAGRVVGTQEMDDRLVVLCENDIGIIAGQGPAPTGLQGQYSDFATASVGVGCDWDSPKSIIREPGGVWFRSDAGFRLFSRSGGLALSDDGKQAGAGVDLLASGTAVAVRGSAKQQIRFYQSSGTCLVWDFQWRQWTRFTAMANVDAIYADGRYYHVSNVSSAPLVRYTDPTLGTDTSDAGAAGAVYTCVVETSWMSLAGIQGFQRIYRLMLLGITTDASVGTLEMGITLSYDFTSEGSVTVGKTVTPATGGIVQLQHHLARQKCEALKVYIFWYPSSGSNVSRFRLTDLTLQCGIKQGYNKLPSSARF